MPLAAAPAINFLGGYEVGFKLQDSGEPNNLQRIALQVTGVPDGTPTQPGNASPYCVTRIGAPGTIVPAGPELQFEGDGAYTVKVSIGPGTGDGASCLAGPSRSGSFGVDVHVTPVLVGEPLSLRLAPLPGMPFVGVQAAAPPGGEADVRCTLGALSVPDPSFAASGGDRGRLPAARPVVVHRARRRRGPRRQQRHRQLRHAVVGAPARRRAQRLPPRCGEHLAPALQAPALHLQGGVARRGGRRARDAHALPRHRAARAAGSSSARRRRSTGASAPSRCGS